MKEWDLQRKELGRRGEEIASDFLEDKGLQIISRNHHSGHRELDIICAEPVKGGVNLRFVEVKTRREPVQGEAWEAVNRKKQLNLVNAAKTYMASDEFKDQKLYCQEIFFDIVTIVWSEDGSSHSLDYIPDAFRIFYV